MKRNQKGFTLIELLVVIAIIGVLSTLAVVSLNTARAKSRDSKRISDIKQMQNALELYFNDATSYPILVTADTLGQGNYKALNTNGFGAAATTGSYMAQVPSNPTPTNDGGCLVNGYRYDSNNGSTYRITYCLGNQTGGVAAGYNTACENGVSGCTIPD